MDLSQIPAGLDPMARDTTVNMASASKLSAEVREKLLTTLTKGFFMNPKRAGEIITLAEFMVKNNYKPGNHRYATTAFNNFQDRSGVIHFIKTRGQNSELAGLSDTYQQIKSLLSPACEEKTSTTTRATSRALPNLLRSATINSPSAALSPLEKRYMNFLLEYGENGVSSEELKAAPKSYANQFKKEQAKNGIRRPNSEYDSLSSAASVTNIACELD